MDEKDPLLSHQIDAVRMLSPHFENIEVVTAREGASKYPKNVRVYNLDWAQNSTPRNILNFYKICIPIMLQRDLAIFSHMTDVHASMVAPLAKVFHQKHYLWYAHTHYSKYLRFCNFFIDGIITSTSGSSPIKGQKVFTIGQAIDPSVFNFLPKRENNLIKAIHIGRFDRSKNLGLIATARNNLEIRGYEVVIFQIGNPTTSKAVKYSSKFKELFASEIASKKITIQPSVVRENIPKILADSDFFIHAYDGSLDKTLIEATMCGLPVVTINPEYIDEFGTWSNSKTPSLEDEYIALKSLGTEERLRKLLERRLIAEQRHSIDNWINNLLSVLREDL